MRKLERKPGKPEVRRIRRTIVFPGLPLEKTNAPDQSKAGWLTGLKSDYNSNTAASLLSLITQLISVEISKKE